MRIEGAVHDRRRRIVTAAGDRAEAVSREVKPDTAKRWRLFFLVVVLGYPFTVALMLPFGDPHPSSFLTHVVFTCALALLLWPVGLLVGAALMTVIVWLSSWFDQDKRSNETPTLVVVGASLAVLGVFLLWSGYIAYRRWHGV